VHGIRSVKSPHPTADKRKSQRPVSAALAGAEVAPGFGAPATGGFGAGCGATGAAAAAKSRVGSRPDDLQRLLVRHARPAFAVLARETRDIGFDRIEARAGARLAAHPDHDRPVVLADVRRGLVLRDPLLDLDRRRELERAPLEPGAAQLDLRRLARRAVGGHVLRLRPVVEVPAGVDPDLEGELRLRPVEAAVERPARLVLGGCCACEQPDEAGEEEQRVLHAARRKGGDPITRPTKRPILVGARSK
jgi:hypothetical protein